MEGLLSLNWIPIGEEREMEGRTPSNFKQNISHWNDWEGKHIHCSSPPFPFQKYYPNIMLVFRSCKVNLRYLDQEKLREELRLGLGV